MTWMVVSNWHSSILLASELTYLLDHACSTEVMDAGEIRRDNALDPESSFSAHVSLSTCVFARLSPVLMLHRRMAAGRKSPWAPKAIAYAHACEHARNCPADDEKRGNIPKQ